MKTFCSEVYISSIKLVSVYTNQVSALVLIFFKDNLYKTRSTKNFNKQRFNLRKILIENQHQLYSIYFRFFNY